MSNQNLLLSAGKQVRSGKIGKIIGLDPASFLFPLNKPNKRLHSEDALYVETIQTDASKLGYSEPIGTVSIYVSKTMNIPKNMNLLHVIFFTLIITHI